MANEFDIARLITLSTAHITEKTEELLRVECNENNLMISVYNKNDYGYFIFIDESTKEKALSDNDALPEDLRACIKFAIEKECEWLCLDCDGEPVDGLPTYEW